MLIYAGIDEAGYGPMLGPLCVAAAVFVVPDHDPEAGAPDLWKALNRAVCRSRSDRLRRIAIEDSKKLKGAKNGPAHPLKQLERGVLSFLANQRPATGEVAGKSDSELGIDLPATDDELFRRLDAAVASAPWYRSTTDLPVAHEPDELRIAARRLGRALDRGGVGFRALHCATIDAGELNRAVERTRNKASVNLTAALRLVHRIWEHWRDGHPRIILDHQGGRTHYREELMTAWPDMRLQVLAENARLSRYRLERGGSSITLTFQTEAETAHLPVALASMTAKLTRELLMLRMNRFFADQMPELKPTAGYTMDARRYLTEIAPVLDRMGLPRSELIRSI